MGGGKGFGFYIVKLYFYAAFGKVIRPYALKIGQNLLRMHGLSRLQIPQLGRRHGRQMPQMRKVFSAASIVSEPRIRISSFKSPHALE